MATIDDKVVAMSFEASKFESGVNQAIASLEKLKGSLKLPSSAKGLDDVGAAAKRIDLSHIGRGIDAIQQKLGYFSVAALAIFANVAMKAVSAGAQITKALTIDPVIQGFKEYETQINAVQVILSNTAVAGTKLKDVNATLDELNEYADKTIYNFTEMTRNIGMFTAAGVDLETSAASIKGIANMAALSGSNATQAATAMYQLSQAISAGKVQLADWRSVENASMGSATFKRALAETAVHMGTLKESAVTLQGAMKNVTINGKSFRASLASKPGEDSWLTSGVLTQTLKQLSGDMTDAQLAAEGYTKEQIKSIQAMAKTALESATTVKTLSQLIATTKEQVGSGWAQTWRLIFGDFGEAKSLFTGASNAIGAFVQKNADARNKVLKDWKDMGGRTAAIDAIKTTFTNLGLILKPIKEAFREIFPRKTGEDLMYITQRFERFADALKPSEKTMANLKRTFAGIFAALDIGKQIVSGIFTVFKELFGALGGGDGGFLSLTANIGDFVVKIDEALKKGDRLHNFFVALGKVLAAPVELLSKFAGAIGEVIGALGSNKVSTGLNDVTEAATPLQAVLNALTNAWNSFSDSIKNSVDMSSVLESIGEAISGIGVAIGKAASSMNFEAILAVIRTGLFGALVLMFKQFLGKGSFLNQVSEGFSKGIISNISGIFSGLNGQMKAMQQNIKAKTLKEIAIAIALLAGALLVISLIDPERLNSSLGAMTIMFGELIGAMALLEKVANSKGFLKLPIIIASLIGLAAAIDLLTIAVVAMSFLSWNDLIKGLTGVGALLVGITKAAGPLSANSVGLIKASAGIFVLAAALNVMALAVRQMGSLSWEELVKGLIGVGVGLKAIVLTMNALPVGENAVAFKSALAIIALAVALKILASAISDLAKLSWEEMARGLTGVGVALGGIVLAMKYMPKPKYLAGVGTELLLVAAALWVISDAVVKMGALSYSEMAKGLIALGGSMLILVKGMNAAAGSLKGAAALGIIAVSLALLAPALVMLGKQSWTSIGKSLVSLAGGLIVIGRAGNAITTATPALLAFGAAVALVGAGIALAGGGFFLFAAGLSTVAVAGPAAIGVLIAAINEFLKAIPEFATNLAIGMLAVVEAFAKTAPQFVDAMVKIINSLLDVIIQASPKVGEAIIALIDTILRVLAERQDEIIAAGFALLIALLQGIKDNIAQVTTMVLDIIVTFLGTLTANIGRIVAAGGNLLVQFLKGIANNIAKVVLAAGEIIVKFISAIATNWMKIVTVGATLIVKFIQGITSNFGKILKAGTDMIVQVVTGIGEAANKIVNAAVRMAGTFIKNLATAVIALANDVVTAIITLMNGVADLIETRSGELGAATARIGIAIVHGMANAIRGGVGEIKDALLSLIPGPLKKFAGRLGIDSPSKVFYGFGENIIQGLAIGIGDNKKEVEDSMVAMSTAIIDSVKTIFRMNSPSEVMKELGQFVTQGFAQGLRGGKADINAAFKELNDMLTKTMSDARTTIISEQKKLDELRKSEKPDVEAIAKSQKIIDENQRLLQRSIATRKLLVTSLKTEKNELIKLSGEYEKIQTRLEAARAKLRQLYDEKDAFKTSIKDQYSELPDIPTTDAEGNALTPDQQVAAYLEALKTQSAAVATYKTTLAELRKLGLDDETYEKLLSDGTADQAFAEALLAGGKTAVEALNTLDSDLQKVSNSLATQSARNLKRAGIEGAKGLLKGLTSENAKIKKAMNDLIDDIEKEIRKRLGIKSPSKVFEEIGSYAMEGLANGFDKSAKLVTDAAMNAADVAIESMKNSIRRMSDVVNSEMDTRPVITPILDLSEVQKKAGALSDMTNVRPITAAASYGQASTIACEQMAAKIEEMTSVVADAAPTVKFEQNNYSPKALTDIEIYRQTKNQLSQIKSVLATT